MADSQAQRLATLPFLQAVAVFVLTMLMWGSTSVVLMFLAAQALPATAPEWAEWPIWSVLLVLVLGIFTLVAVLITGPTVRYLHEQAILRQLRHRVVVKRRNPVRWPFQSVESQ